MKKLLLPALILGTGLGGLALAQTAQDTGLDLEAIRADAAEHQAEAEDLASTVRQRAERLREDSRNVEDDARANAARYAASLSKRPMAKNGAPFDFDAMVLGAAETAKADFGSAPRFIAFASLSMPPAGLRALARDMKRAGGVTVLRGFPGGSAKLLRARLAQVWDEGDAFAAIGIDPRLFRAFAVQAAPTFVMAGSDFELCDGFDCAPAVPPHDRMAGNVSVAFVLESFAGGGGPGAALARLHLARLNEGEDQ
ncbi:type-F conjugative transfer system pilin assembly protein TrbC [Novosphingopyxis sp.]|uniref:type-F conjugative transfer system pilin assembly protein TrbC n=1 Tax=Novosphingopyxis sp. TaxID=2709690 RepID=UPI003B590F33